MADKKKLSIKYFPASELVTFPGNPRKLKDPDAVKKLTKLIEAHGFQNPLQVWQHEGVNYILCGNHRFKAACDLGYTEFPCIVYSGTKEEALARVISDNKSSDWTEFDYPLLKDMITEIDLGHLDIEITGFGEEELEALFGYEGLTEEEQAEKDAIEDDVPDVPVEPVTRLGDLYLLGRHRLLCGDSINITDVERLMDGKKADMVFTDPPYGIDVVTNNSRMRDLGWKQYANDGDMSVAVDAFNLSMGLCDKLVFWGGNHFANKLPNSPGWIVWDKQDGKDSLTYSMAELAWTNVISNVQVFTHVWDGFRKDSERNSKRVHPSQKPVALAQWFLEKWGGQLDNILDLFLGSGSTLIACEKTGRTCYGMELDTHYCDVIVARWEKFTGKKAELCQPS